MKGAILVAGTASHVGKSVGVAGLCRWLRRRAVSVAPFKAQNMSLNSAVTSEGAEIGRAQAAQAAAAGVAPEAAMNPILIKPTGERSCQVIVMGEPAADTDASGYQKMKSRLFPVVLDALADLRSRFDVVVCEGAGSPTEINLRASDITNMGLARAASLPVVVFGDIERGGVFASLYGSLALLDAEDQRCVAGFVINRFRGDRSILDPGLERLEELTGRPVLGVLPWIDGLSVDAEDSLALDVESPPIDSDAITVSVVRLPRISNFTDVEALRAEPGVVVRFTTSADEVLSADLAIVPGTKATVDDLAFVRSSGIADALGKRAAADLPVLAICGGYQMLGSRIVDGVESKQSVIEGLGLLPVETVFAREKVRSTPTGVAVAFGDVPVAGYEIRHGRTKRLGGIPVLRGDGDEGCRVGNVVGITWHGALEADSFRTEVLRWVATSRGRAWGPSGVRFADIREAQLDRMGDLIEQHLDLKAVERIITDGAPEGLPYIQAALVR